MFYRSICLALVAVVLHGSISAQDQPQSSSQTLAEMQQVLRKAQAKNKAVKVTLRTTIDNQKKFSGKVSDISDTSFVITDQRTGAAKQLAYEEVHEVQQKSGALKTMGIVLAGVGVLILAAMIYRAIGGNDPV